MFLPNFRVHKNLQQNSNLKRLLPKQIFNYIFSNYYKTNIFKLYAHRHNCTMFIFSITCTHILIN